MEASVEIALRRLLCPIPPDNIPSHSAPNQLPIACTTPPPPHTFHRTLHPPPNLQHPTTHPTRPTQNHQALAQVELLKNENAKLEYRVLHLLRALNMLEAQQKQ